MQRREALYRKLQSATAYPETIQEKYQDKELPLELIEPLHALVQYASGDPPGDITPGANDRLA